MGWEESWHEVLRRLGALILPFIKDCGHSAPTVILSSLARVMVAGSLEQEPGHFQPKAELSIGSLCYSLPGNPAPKWGGYLELGY